MFRRGDRNVDFFLVLEGGIDIFEPTPRGKEHELIQLGPNQFTGELDLFNERQVLVSGRAAPGTRVLRIKRADFRRMVAAEPDIGEIIMRAFILRRVGLIRHSEGGVVLIGPRPRRRHAAPAALPRAQCLSACACSTPRPIRTPAASSPASS